MKLVEILARELSEWPEFAEYAWQDYDLEVRFSAGIGQDFLASQLASDHLRQPGEENPDNGVTREMWEAERARIAGPKEWNGEGLPPVEQDVLMLMSSEPELDYEKVRILMHTNIGHVVYQRESGAAGVCDHLKFYDDPIYLPIPIRTERERWIEAAERALEFSVSVPANTKALGVLYDAGLAKLPEDGE